MIKVLRNKEKLKQRVEIVDLPRLVSAIQQINNNILCTKVNLLWTKCTFLPSNQPFFSYLQLNIFRKKKLSKQMDFANNVNLTAVSHVVVDFIGSIMILSSFSGTALTAL